MGLDSDKHYNILEARAEDAMWDNADLNCSALEARAEESLDDDETFSEVLHDWADSEVVDSTIRAMYFALENNNDASALVFAKSLAATIKEAAIKREGSL